MSLEFRSKIMHYPHKVSNRKRVRKIGFRARMKTKKGRQTLNRKRRAGRSVNSV
jgi:large subunit ribosomal protein L34